MDPTDTDLMLPKCLHTEVSNVVCKKKQREVCGDCDNHHSCTIGGLIESKMVRIRCGANSGFPIKKNKEMIELTLTQTTHNHFLLLPAYTVSLNILCVYWCHDL